MFMRWFLWFLFVLLAIQPLRVDARDNGQYAQVDPELRRWFNGLQDNKGYGCCSTADGVLLKTDAYDPEWTCGADKCRVKIMGQWYDVPDQALLTVPNRMGPAIVWWVYDTLDDENGTSTGAVKIRCFLRGLET